MDLPPSQPSPTGEGVELNPFPLGETGKGVRNMRKNAHLISSLLPFPPLRVYGVQIQSLRPYHWR
jgi:hypothetical protein